MDLRQAMNFSPEFDLTRSDSNPNPFVVKEGLSLRLGYNVQFPDTRGNLPIVMHFEETSSHSRTFLPHPDTCTMRHEILHKGDPRSSNKGVAFLSFSPAERVNDPSTWPYLALEASDSPQSSLCGYVSYHKTLAEAAEYDRLRSTIKSTARNGGNNVNQTLLALTYQLKDRFGLTAGHRIALNKLELELNLPLTVFEDFVVPRSPLSDDSVSSLFTGYRVVLRDFDDDSETDGAVGVVEGWDGHTGKFNVKLDGEDVARPFCPVNIALALAS